MPETLKRQLDGLKLTQQPTLEEEFSRLSRSAFYESSSITRRRSEIDPRLYQEARNAARAKIDLPLFKPTLRQKFKETKQCVPFIADDSVSLEVRLSFNGFPPSTLTQKVSQSETLGALVNDLVYKKKILSKEEARLATYSSGKHLLTPIDPLSRVVETGGVLDISVGGKEAQSSILCAARETLPRLGNNDLVISPNLQALERLTSTELSAVSDFCVSNRHARVEFLAPVDLRNVQLDCVVHLGRKTVEMYPGRAEKPLPGQGLNQPARITYFDFKYPPLDKQDEFMQRLQASVEEKGAELLAADPEKQLLVIKVEHF